MLRKTAVVVSLISLSLPCWSNGFYLGAGLGPDLIDFNQNARITKPGDFNAGDKTHLSGRGVFGTVFGGYGWQHQRFYLAGEANANLSSAEFKSSNEELIHSSFSKTVYKMRRNYGLSLLPGFVFSETLLAYGRLGYVNGNFKTITSDTSLANVNRYLDGFRWGLGLNQAISQHLAVRMEYSNLNYQKTKFTAIDDLVTKTTRIRPTANQVEFGLVYNFDYIEKSK